MDESQTPVLPETGVVKFFNKTRGFGFVQLDSHEPDLFFSFVALYMANKQAIDTGTRVTVIRGVSSTGKSRVERFLEIDGVPAEYGKFTLVEGGFVFASEGSRPRPAQAPPDKDGASEKVEHGYVDAFYKKRGFGFVVVDGGGSLFFYITELMKANMDDIELSTRVAFVRGKGRDGRPKVARFVEVGGAPVTVGGYNIVNRRYVFYRDGKPPPAALQEEAPSKTEAVEPKLEPVPAPAPTRAPEPVIDKDEWLVVTLRKVRQTHMSYAKSDLLGQIKVPWPVLQKAGITCARGEEKFELKCEPGEDLPVAREIRRY